jgi:PAS domain S-box-containing protein
VSTERNPFFVVAPDVATAHLAAIVASSSDAILSKNLDGTIISWNAGAARMFGYSAVEMIGQSILRLIPPELVSEEDVILARLGAGERIDHYETVRVTKDGRRLDVSLTISPIHDAVGNVVAASKIIRDITERKLAETRIQLLLRELNHRARNTFAVVQAIALRSAQDADPMTFATSLSDRLQGLAACQSLLINNEWRSVDLRDLIQTQLTPFTDLGDGRISVMGSTAKLRPSAAQAIGMALHELATNASKHGALSVGEGKVHIAWHLEAKEESEFVMIWRESGGPKVGPPARSGFGQTVIVRMTEMALRGHVELDYAEDGFSWVLRSPARETLEDEVS